MIKTEDPWKELSQRLAGLELALEVQAAAIPTGSADELVRNDVADVLVALARAIRGTTSAGVGVAGRREP